MTKIKPISIILMLSLLVALLVSGCCPGGKAMRGDKKDLDERIKTLEAKLGIQEDIEEIRRLQHIYGYYMDNNLNHRVLDLFSDKAVSAEMGGRGVYVGKEAIKTLFIDVHVGGIPDGPIYGMFTAFNQLQDVIDVAPDRKTAKGRFKAFLLQGSFKKFGAWQAGIYENEYVKEDGKWKISKFVYKQIFTGQYGDFWNNPMWSAGPSTKFPPDQPSTPYHPFPENWIFPYHYTHPITGEKIPEFLPTTQYWCGPTPCKP